MKILHLEDNPHDAELVREQLLEEWPDCDIKAVATRNAFLSEVQHGEHDLILSDFTLASFNGLEALKIARNHRPDTPFIFLSGTIGEDRAIAAVKAGAHDYVLKDHMKRLIVALRSALRDSAERKQRRLAEDAHRRLAAILENTSDFVGMFAPDGHMLYVNHAGLQMVGLPADEDVLARRFAGFHPPEVAARLAREIIPAVLRDGTWSGELALLSSEGRHIPVSCVLLTHGTPDGTVEYLSALMRDLTAQKQADRRIREQADFLDRASDVIVVDDLEGTITSWNRGAERALGWSASEAVGRRYTEVFSPADHAAIHAVRQVLEIDGEWRGEIQLHDRQGRLRNFDSRVTVIRDDAGRPRAHLTINTDITEKKHLEEKFLRAQRLESIGMLASGIAHDLNNILAPILLAAPMLRERATDPSDFQLLSSLEKGAERGAALVRQILSFAQGAGGEPRLIQVKHLVRDITGIIRETFPKNIVLDEDVGSELWPITANPTQIHQVLLNLVVNARDAMPQGGTLRVQAKNQVLDDLAARKIEGGRPGAYLVLEVEDGGTGIPPDVLAHIWEPFFTTKPAGRGTGLGLSTVRGIVETHQGFVTLRTALKRGTTFTVYLPAAEGALIGDQENPPIHIPRGRGELILVVDDELNVRDLITAILTHHGYRILTARDGVEAVALFAPRGAEVALVITDVNMPNLDGTALAGVLRRLQPALKVITVSGMAQESRPEPTEGTRPSAFLPKPFKAEALLRLVHQLLHEKAAKK